MSCFMKGERKKPKRQTVIPRNLREKRVLIRKDTVESIRIK